MKKPTQEEAEAATCVFWDMDMCPVPAGYDPGVVRGCIKRLLEKNGYGGPLNVIAFGKLVDVSTDMLRRVYSSGIALVNVYRGSADFPDLIGLFAKPTPMNLMLISGRETWPVFAKILRMWKYNPLQPFPFHSLDHLILKYSRGEFEEEETTGESAFWDCLVCARDPPSKVFENLTTHLDSEEHHELFNEMLTLNSVAPPLPVDPDMVRLLPPPPKFISPPTIKTPSGYRVIDWESVKSDYETYVFWDVNSCPVPPGFDASLVGPCIKRFLKKEGCFGPLSIIAVGLLTDIPIDMLRKLYSSGIFLHNVPHGPSDTSSLIQNWSYSDEGLCSIMVLSNAKIFAYYSLSLSKRLNLLQPFPNDSLQSICLADSGALEEEDECSGTGDSASWVCSVCDYRNTPNQGFESFTMHISGTNHRQKLSELLPISGRLRILSTPLSEPTEINLEAVTSVFWDMKTCSVPPGFDPRWVGPCIKRYLANNRYSGPLTLTAVGVLTDVPLDTLRGVYSSGITLINGFSAAKDLIFEFTHENPPPANILVISDDKCCTSEYAFGLQLKGYNLLQPFPCGSLESFLLPDSGLIGEDKCSDSALWICSVCSLDGQGFENFISHVTSRRHERKLLDYLPGKDRILRGEILPTMVTKARKKQPESATSVYVMKKKKEERQAERKKMEWQEKMIREETKKRWEEEKITRLKEQRYINWRILGLFSSAESHGMAN